MKQHLRFKNIHPRIVGAAERVFEERPWHATETVQQDIGQEFLAALAATYNVTEPLLTIDRYFSMDSYDPADIDALGELVTRASIEMRKWSIIRLFSMARLHVVQEDGADAISMDDEIGWACSLFYRVRPVMFRARAREGRIVGVTAKDTFRDSSWDRLVQAGVTEGNNLTVSPLAAMQIINEEPQDSDEEISEIDTQEEPVFRVEDREVTPEIAAGQTLHDEVEQALVAGVDYEESTPANPDWANEDGTPNHEAIAAEFSDGLNALNRDAIRALAKANGIPRGDMNKDQLIEALRAAGVQA